MTTNETHDAVKITEAAIRAVCEMRGDNDEDGMLLPAEMLPIDLAIHVRVKDWTFAPYAREDVWVIVTMAGHGTFTGRIATDRDHEERAQYD